MPEPVFLEPRKLLFLYLHGKCLKLITYLFRRPNGFKSQVFSAAVAMGEPSRINLDVPRYDQSTYWGRATHFFVTTNPMNLFATPSALDTAKDVVTRHRKVRKSSI